jgi:hypothetical protein
VRQPEESSHQMHDEPDILRIWLDYIIGFVVDKQSQQAPQ